MGPPLALLLLLLLLPPRPPAAPAPASRARLLPGLLGCLLEDGLCRPSETCVNDGVFGRCQKFPVMDVYRYEVSPAGLQQLTATLQQLSRTGFSWQDDYTQRVMAQELSHLPRTYLRRPEAALPARNSQPGVDDGRRHGLEDDAALAEALERYLPYLEALSQAAAPDALPRTKQDRPPAQGEDRVADGVRTYEAQTSALTFAPASWAGHPAGGALRTPGRLPPDELSPKVDGGMRKRNLVAALGAYLALQPPTPSAEGKLTPHDLMRMPWRVPRVLSAPSASKKWSSPAEGPGDSAGPHDGALTPTPRKEPGKLPLGVERPRPMDLDAVARVLADAVHGGGAARQWRGPGRGAGGRPREPAGSSEDGGTWGGDGLRANGVQDDGGGADEQVHRLRLELGDVPQDPRSQRLPGASPLAGPFEAETKKAEGAEDAWLWEEERAGVENVRSQTYSKELRGRGDGLGGRQPWAPGALQVDAPLGAGTRGRPDGGLRLAVTASEEEYGYIVTADDPLSPEKGKELMEDVARLLPLPASIFADVAVLGPAVTFRVSANVQNVTTADVAKAAVDGKDKLERSSGLRILQAGVGPKSKIKLLPHRAAQEDSTKFAVLTLVSIAAIVGVLLASGAIYCLRHSSRYRLKEKLSGLGDPGPDATAAYQELCRQRMATRPSERPEAPRASRVSSVSSQLSDGPTPSPPARGSTSSWSEEPAPPSMDISTGHMVLAYMEDHLQNKDRLQKEWEALCAYQAEPNSSLVAQREENVPKNRCPAVLTCTYARGCGGHGGRRVGGGGRDPRVGPGGGAAGPPHCGWPGLRRAPHSPRPTCDCISDSLLSSACDLSLQTDHDPRSPAYIATQGPLPTTVADFWQMVWEEGCVVIVMLTPLSENGVRQCHHYWPDEGSSLYHIYEVNLVSEHIWCEDFLVRSLYLKNLQTGETRTVTQFHFLSWYDQGVPPSTRPLLDFRRKVNKCYRGRSCPIIVHCSDGAGRSGTYILIDLVLNKMAKGAKELDIAATLEHLRDQRPAMVQTKEQFEFALTAVAEEVNAILQALPQ
ncbi:receptor-type tyrosine-protein phosphatase N2 [Pteropus medius]|uniref:receptor-type tyrosine-protein phosphatase N2 n=1 Tax=Pteropus vampyrus TaxID=132908 RepID=UPI00196B943D|nr:receptor-type tyrosine-protein phosphatase N2 [Pteropus giganteus]